MPKLRKWLAFWMALMLMILLPVSVGANSAEPPGMIIIVSGAPSDLTVTLELPGDSEADLRVTESTKVWERHFRIYYHTDMDSLSQAVIRVTGKEKSFTCPLPAGVDTGYNNLLTLDYQKETLTLGQSPWRQPLLTALRVTLTLLLEGLVFWLFGFRGKRSWIAFLLVNLLTQGALNIWVNGYSFAGGYWVIGYILWEILIIIGESIALPLAINEKKKWLTLLYAIAANVLSLFLGSQLIGRLPL